MAPVEVSRIVTQAAAAAVIGAVAFALLFISSGRPVHAQPTVTALAIDVDVTGNGDNVLGPTDVCNAAPIAIGDTVQIDAVVRGVPPYDGYAGGVAGFSFKILFDPSVVEVTDVLAFAGPTILAVNGTPVPFEIVDYDGTNWNNADPPPGTTGSVQAAMVDLSANAPANGDGVMTRITLQAVGNGVSALHLAGFYPDPGPLIEDGLANSYSIGSVQDAVVVIGGGSCPSYGIGAISGVVQDHFGNPIAGAKVTFGDQTPFATVTTDAGGHYTEQGLSATQMYVVSVQAAGYASGYWTGAGGVTPDFWNAARVLVPADGVAEVDFSLGRFSIISGRVTDKQGNVLAGAYVTAAFGYSSYHAKTGADGTYSIFLDAAPDGRYTVLATLPGFASEYWTPYGGTTDRTQAGTVLVVGGTDQVIDADLALPRLGAIAGTVTDRSGAPIAGANVNLSCKTCGAGLLATTGADGSFALQNLSAGDYYLYAYANGFLLRWWTSGGGTASGGAAELVHVQLDTVVSGTNFLLPRAGVITGRVRNTSGAGVPGVRVETSWSPRQYAYTDSGGGYRISGLEAGQYTLYARAQSPYLSEYWTSSGGNPVQGQGITVAEEATVQNIDFTVLRPGYISGQIVDQHSNTIRGAGISLLAATCYGCRQVYSGYDGTYYIASIWPGSYVLFASAPGYAPEYWKANGGVPSRSAATTIIVQEGQQLTGLNFIMHPSTTPTPNPSPAATPTPTPTPLPPLVRR